MYCQRYEQPEIYNRKIFPTVEIYSIPQIHVVRSQNPHMHNTFSERGWYNITFDRCGLPRTDKWLDQDGDTDPSS